MTIKTIITEPNKILRQVSKPVPIVGNEERKLMDDMLETMYAANGIGLAAIQIGIPKRIIVMDISKDGNKNPMFFVKGKAGSWGATYTIFWESKAVYQDRFLPVSWVNRVPKTVKQ